MTVPPWIAPAAIGAVTAALLVWNLAVGARLAARASTRPAFRLLGSLAAFLLVPALVIGVLAPTTAGARVLTPLAWLWPAVAVGIAVQAVWALGQRKAHLLHTLPVVLVDGLVAWIALARWSESLGAGLPPVLLAPGVAAASLGAAALGERAYHWSAWLLVPVLAPAAASRSPLRAAGRTLLAAWCAALLALIGARLPLAVDDLHAVRALGGATLTERTRDDFAVGLRLFGDVTAPPSAATARHDAGLADSLGVSAVLVTIMPDGATGPSLDSLSRLLEGRRDAVTLIVSLPFARGDGAPFAAGDDRWLASRTALVERTVRRLHPDILLPAGDQPPAGEADAWKSYYVRLTRAARRLDRNVTIALATRASTPLDSVLCDWVGSGESSVNAIALTAMAGAGNPARAGAARAALARWIGLAAAPPSVWLVALPFAPAVDGEIAQQHVVRQALSWAAAHAWVRGVIAGDAADLWLDGGLRTASLRSRPALAEVGSALKALRESTAPPPMRPDTAATDTARGRSISPIPDQP